MKLIQKIINFFTKKKVVKPKKINPRDIECLYGPFGGFVSNITDKSQERFETIGKSQKINEEKNRIEQKEEEK